MPGHLGKRGEPARELVLEHPVPHVGVHPDGTAKIGLDHLLHAKRVNGDVRKRLSLISTREAGQTVRRVLDEDGTCGVSGIGKTTVALSLDDAEAVLQHHGPQV